MELKIKRPPGTWVHTGLRSYGATGLRGATGYGAAGTMVKKCLSANCIFGTYGTRNPLTRSFFTEMLFLSKNRQIHKKSTF